MAGTGLIIVPVSIRVCDPTLPGFNEAVSKSQVNGRLAFDMDELRSAYSRTVPGVAVYYNGEFLGECTADDAEKVKHLTQSPITSK